MTAILKILITPDQPEWAKFAIADLRSLDYIQLFDVATMANNTFDIVMHFGYYSAAIQKKYGAGRLGFWYFCFGGNDIHPATAAKKTAALHTAFETSLWAKMPEGNTMCLYQSFGQLTQFTLGRNLLRALHKSARFPQRAIEHYRRMEKLEPHTPELVSISSSLLFSTLSEWTAITRKIFYRLFYIEQWFIVAGKGNDLIPSLAEATWRVNPPNTEFWADPFPIEREGKIWLLFEALPFKTQCGYLAAIELFEDGSHSESITIMKTNSHLSYPFVFEWEGGLYMIPEAGATKEVTLWKCEEFPNHWIKVSTLLKNVCYSDATVFYSDNFWWLFMTIKSEGACLNDELYLYFAHTPLGPWTHHQNNPIKSDARSARPAGNIFIKNGNIYRPAQDCSTIYGEAIALNRIDSLTTKKFAETTIARIDANWAPNNRRTHTLTRSKQYWAADGLRYIPRWHFFHKVVTRLTGNAH